MADAKQETGSWVLTWQALWTSRATALTRLVASVAAGCLLGGLAMCLVWGTAATNLQTINISATTNTFGYTLYRVPISRQSIAIPLAVAGILWGLLLFSLWRTRSGPAVAFPSSLNVRRMVLWSTIGSAVLIAVAAQGVAMLQWSKFVPGDRRYLTINVALLAAGGVLLIWLPFIEIIQRRAKPLLNPQGEVRVHCPTCGYSLIGLRELRCPECGTQFTIDELIRAQSYDTAPLDPSASRPAQDAI